MPNTQARLNTATSHVAEKKRARLEHLARERTKLTHSKNREQTMNSGRF